MKSGYYQKIDMTSLAVLDCCDYYSEGYIITRINVPRAHRSKGWASKLLVDCIADADAEGVDLFLEIAPSDGLNRDQLVAWYKRYGFRDIGGIWRRQACKNVKKPLSTSSA